MKQDKLAALFDFDGVIVDTESQYSVFWNSIGERFLNKKDFGKETKSVTLKKILSIYFSGSPELHEKIARELEEFERNIKYEPVRGVFGFIDDLRKNGVATGLVTSSNNAKMKIVYGVRPDLPGYFDTILTAESFEHSKPDPEGYLKAMDVLGVTPGGSFVFEDSFPGLAAGRSSGAMVIALATTNPPGALAGEADYIIADFTNMDYDRLVAMKKR